MVTVDSKQPTSLLMEGNHTTAEWLLSAAPMLFVTLSIAMVTGRWLFSKRNGHDVKRKQAAVVPVVGRHLLPRTPIDNSKRWVELGASELQFVRLATEQPGGNRIYLIATVTGPHISKEKLEYAALCIQRMHPLLRCRLIKVGGNIVLEEDSQLRLNVEVRQRHGPQTCREVFKRVVEKVPIEIADNAKSPHTLWLFQDADAKNGLSVERETFEIVLDLAHFAIDGSGLAPLMHEVLQYTLEEKLPLPAYGAWPISQCTAIEGALSQKMTWFGKIIAKLRMLMYFTWLSASQELLHLPRDDDLPRREYGIRHSTHSLRQQLNGAETKAFVAKCKSKQVSVTAAITAAFLEACAEVNQPHVRKPFRATLFLVADSRRVYDAPSTDLAPHVYGAPLFTTEIRRWDSELNKPERTWKLANGIKDHIRKVTADPLDAALQAYWLPAFFQMQPLSTKAPMLNVSSWCASAPVQERYNGDRFLVDDVELFENLAYHSWINVSIYTFVGKLNMTMLAPTPRFQESLLNDVFERATMKVRSLLES